MPAFSYWCWFLPSLALACAAGRWLGEALLAQPLYGVIAGGGAALAGLVVTSRVPPWMRKLGLPSDARPWSQIWMALLTLVGMACWGLFGRGAGWCVAFLLGKPRAAGMEWGLVIGAALAWLTMVAEHTVFGDPGAHDHVHGDARPATLPEMQARDVTVHASSGIHLGYVMEERPR